MVLLHGCSYAENHAGEVPTTGFSMMVVMMMIVMMEMVMTVKLMMMVTMMAVILMLIVRVGCQC